MSMCKSQRGISFFSLLVILVVAGMFLSVGFKLYSPYWNHSQVSSIMEDLTHELDTKTDTPRETRLKISKRLLINQIKLPPGAVVIKIHEGVKTLTLKYNIVVPMYYNVDAVVKFNEQYEVIIR